MSTASSPSTRMSISSTSVWIAGLWSWNPAISAALCCAASSTWSQQATTSMSSIPAFRSSFRPPTWAPAMPPQPTRANRNGSVMGSPFTAR